MDKVDLIELNDYVYEWFTIIVQGLPQLLIVYGKVESIRAGCHIQVAFALNDLETCEYLSKSTCKMIILKEN